MKHKVIALTAALSMLGGSIAALPAMAAGNIVDNGAFEADTASWESTGSNALSWVGTHADKPGVANIAANSDASGAAHGIRQDLLSKGIKPDSTYTFEADIYTLDTTYETATFNIYFLTSWTPDKDHYGNPTASNIVAGGGTQLTPNQWNHVKYTLETPAEDSDLWKKVKGEYRYSSSETETVAPPAELNLTIESNWGTNAAFYIDNITLTKVGDEPTAPASYTTKVGAAEVQKGTGEFENTVATGFRATVTNNGGKGSFNTVQWDVTSNGVEKTTGEQTMKTTVTLKTNAQATISLIVNGLNDANAKAEVQIIK